MNELKPCPFCGGKADVYTVTEYPCRVYIIRCVKCGVSGTGLYVAEAEAAEAWNRRAERTCTPIRRTAKSQIYGATIVLWNCSVCGGFIRPHWKYCVECGAKVVVE